MTIVTGPENIRVIAIVRGGIEVQMTKEGIGPIARGEMKTKAVIDQGESVHGLQNQTARGVTGSMDLERTTATPTMTGPVDANEKRREEQMNDEESDQPRESRTDADNISGYIHKTEGSKHCHCCEAKSNHTVL